MKNEIIIKLKERIKEIDSNRFTDDFSKNDKYRIEGLQTAINLIEKMDI